MLRRRVRDDGFEIIDKPTYHKLTNSFIKNNGIIIRGEEAEKHLKNMDGYASYMVGGNVAFIRNDATVSDVLEEMYHAKQDRSNKFGEVLNREVLLRREIDAQQYMLSVADKYKIPESEIRITQENLKRYQKELENIIKGDV
jgi:hypothetical protein